ncbi:multidrug resistance-associated protein 1 isoform X1 [Tribolium madens]|uniref:multidrug resistance-associated protein 1 isoform X1 n=1 Tax=Tribolium madens TaxID=41895 RepID=UPI001CF7357A|nr:multidrug resistance-associated protein 1 isoform X1 [Tribolium madens]XP_044271384.1 multidrug resistance-associated protein 1 isoform X1 [Tribolium madens]
MAATTMDKFCGSEFWNSTLTWHTNNPDLTKCFERTVLVWVPCAFLWTFSSLEVYYILHSKRRDIPWNWLNVSKLLGTAILFVLTVTDLVTGINSASSSESDVYKVDIYTPVIKLLTFGLSAVLLVYNRKYGLCTSGLQFLFWLSLAICGAFQYRTEINGSQEEISESQYSYISYLIYYPVVLVMLFLNCFADRPPRRSEYPKLKNPCPEENSSFLSRLLFSWFDPLAWRGFRRPLVDSDLWDMKPEDSASEVVPTFEKHWKRILQKCESNSPTRQTRASYKLDSARVDIVNSSIKKQASILPALIKAFGPTFVFGALLKLIQDLLTFVSPHILDLLIQFVKNNEEQWKGFLYAGALFVTATIQTIVLSQYFNRMFVVGMRIRTALVSAIYKKALRVSNKARKESTVGEIVNLMSVDAQKFIDLTAYINMIWSAPLQIILALYFLWNILGPAVLAGLAVMIILIPVNGYIANKVKVLQIKQMKNKDERVKLMNEVLSGIKVLKLYAWEPSFEKQILKIRSKEIQVLKEAAYMNAGTSFIWSCAPFLVSLVSFGTYVMVDEHNVLDASKAFVSVSLFNILRFPLSMLPMMISNLVQAMVSIQRINKFMNAEELDPTSVTHDPNETAPLVIENGCFNWDEDQILKNINIRVEKKSLCAVVGSVGSGKSSLLSAFLGEMDKISGRVNTVGSIAYVAQQAWIQNATLRDNILFGKSFDKSLYDKVVEACALNPDFAMLPAGDQTEIGEKGINLSGGQKQRVSLARAVYANSDIYFLDDPLSAVDSHVGKHIFDKVIGPEGLLRHKTRVLVTHGITYLPQTDKILVLKDGEVSESGTYQELLDKKGAFSEFLLQHINEVEEDEEELDVLKSQLSGTAVSEEINKKLSRHRSRVSESVSETGSDQTSLSLQRQKSVESTDKSLRHRSSSVEETKKVKGDKLIEIEKAETGSVKWIVYKHYLKSIGIFLTVATIFLNMLFQGFSIGSNVWLGVWADDKTVVVDNVTDTGKRDFYLGIYGALGIGQAIAVLLSALSLYIGALNGAQILHQLLLSNILRVPCTTFFDVTPVGRILNRFSKDVDTVDNILPMTLRGWITCFFSVLGTLVVISVSTPIFVAVIVPIGILYYFIQRFYVATSRQLKRLESVSRSPIYSHFGETITGVQAIRAFREQDRFIKESEHRVDVNQVCYYPSIISNRWLAVRLEMIGNLIIFFAALFSVLGRDESQNAGLVGLSVTYSLQITQTLNWLVRMTSDVETNIVAVERIKEYGEAPQEAPWEIPNKAPSLLWPENGTVQFNKYAVRYRPGLDLVLKGVNFSINGGEKVGIVGRTGAGKSSLTLALFRIIEAAEGEILIDGINIAELGLHTLRSRLTIIPQDAVLFSGTLRMNLDPFDKHSDEEVWKALEHAHLKSFVKGLTAGLHHEVTEGGENLSVGQRQLICLSRALLRKTKVLILDEATAAVDLETDDLIQKTIRSEFKNCTVLTIAHRLNTIMDSDRVVVLDNGMIVEFDSPSNLLKQQQSIFYSMCKDAGLV